MRDVELAIIGGGCAGLSLARDLARHAESYAALSSTVVLEPRTEYANDRTWCFWARDAGADAHLATHRWRAWRFSTDNQQLVHRPGADWAYYHIPSERFYRDALSAVEAAPKIQLHRGIQVTSIEPHPTGLHIETNEGTLIARQVVDTRPCVAAKTPPALLTQAFMGVEIDCDYPLPVVEIVGLMEAMTCDHLGFRFNYILPLSATRLLVEATRFSAVSVTREQLTEDLDHALWSVVPSGRYEVIRREQGSIPMGLTAAPAMSHPEWVQAGISGGAVRAGTGYAYRRIQEWSRLCAQSVSENGSVIGHPPPIRRLQWMDMLFLTVLREQPELAPKLFMSLAHNVAPATLVRFLTERPSINDLLAVIYALPAWPFLKHWGRRAWYELSEQLRSYPRSVQ